MNPAWFSLSDDSLHGRHLTRSPDPSAPSPAVPADLPPIPYDRMWAHDIHWLPCLARGERFVGRADLDEGSVMTRYWFGRVSAGGE